MQLVLLGGYDVTIYIIKANSDDETKRDCTSAFSK
jgi:hypothetical protein